MDELELSGRRHISTKRAGKEHGYHSDYIGQLIRGKKVAGQKVGRSWYVDEVSLREYLGKEGNAATKLGDLEPTLEVLPKKSSGLLSESPSPAEDSAGQTFSPEPPAPEVIEEKVEESTVEVVEEKIEIKKPIIEPVAKPVVEKKVAEEHKVVIHTPKPPIPIRPSGGLTYLPDDEPLLPAVRTRASDERAAGVVEEEPEEILHEEPRRAPRIVRGALVVLLALVMVGLSTIASILVTSTTVVEEGKTASVYYTLGPK